MDRGPPRVIDRPEPGYWAVRLASGAPEVGAAIVRVTRRPADPACPTNLQGACNYLQAFLNGAPASLADVWTRRGRPISEAEYRFLVADRRWAKQWTPHAPEAHPYRRADPRQRAPVLPPKRR